MYDDARIAAGLRGMLTSVEIPPLALANIRGRITRAAGKPERPRTLYWGGAAAAVAILLVALPGIAPAFVQSLETQVEGILHWRPPSAPPRSILAALRSNVGTLAQAQSRVEFTIVQPAGLPTDATPATIATMPGALFSTSTRAWKVRPANVWFTYRRGNGASFTLMAEAYDSRAAAPSKYMFEDEGERDGREIVIRRDRFVWRNGDQVMTAITGDGISASEIIAIRTAMHGIPIAGVWPPRHRAVERMYVKP